MITAGLTGHEIEQCYRRRFRWSLLASGSVFTLTALLSTIVPVQCVPAHLTGAGIHAPRQAAEVLSPRDHPLSAVEALARKRIAAGALLWVEYVITDYADTDEPAPFPEPSAWVTIADLVAIQPEAPDEVVLEIELDESYAARNTSVRSEQSLDFAILHMIRPLYPEFSETAGVEGLITLKATVNPDGKVTRVTAIANETDFLCLRVSEAALREWEFKPMEIHSRAVWFSVVVPFRFRLE